MQKKQPKIRSYLIHNPYIFNGSLDHLKLKEINSFLVFSKQFRIQQGEVNSFLFSGRGNLQESTGVMELRYKDLKLQLLKKG